LLKNVRTFCAYIHRAQFATFRGLTFQTRTFCASFVPCDKERALLIFGYYI